MKRIYITKQELQNENPHLYVLDEDGILLETYGLHWKDEVIQ